CAGGRGLALRFDGADFERGERARGEFGTAGLFGAVSGNSGGVVAARGNRGVVAARPRVPGNGQRGFSRDFAGRRSGSADVRNQCAGHGSDLSGGAGAHFSSERSVVDAEFTIRATVWRAAFAGCAGGGVFAFSPGNGERSFTDQFQSHAGRIRE